MNEANLLVDALRQFQEWPKAVQICGGLIVVGWGLKWAEVFPNKLIPLTVVLLGGVLNALIGDVNRMAFDQRNQEIALFIQGLMIGFVAWLVHKAFIKRIEDKFQPTQPTSVVVPMPGKNENTVDPAKPNE